MSNRRHKSHDTSGTPQDVLDARARLRAKFGNKPTKMGGKGSMTIKKRAHKKSNANDDKKLKAGLRKFAVQPFPDIDEVNLFKDDGTVIHFKKPEGKILINSSDIFSTCINAQSYLLHHGPALD